MCTHDSWNRKPEDDDEHSSSCFFFHTHLLLCTIRGKEWIRGIWWFVFFHVLLNLFLWKQTNKQTKKFNLKWKNNNSKKTQTFVHYVSCVLSSLSYFRALPQVFPPFSTPLIGSALLDYFDHQKGCPFPIFKLNKQAQPVWP